MSTYFLHPDSIRNLFNNIASTYDFLNHFLSFGRDYYWRKKAVQGLEGFEGWILDIATGTGDVAIEIIHQNNHHRKVFGLDFSHPMIKKAQRKVLNKGLSQTITLTLGDALSLPFRDNTFRAAMIAFGLRNIVKKEQALSEMVRVIQKGGKVIILEFTFPQKGLMRRLYPIYFQRAENYEEIMKRAGLENVGSQSLTGGVASVISGIKTC